MSVYVPYYRHPYVYTVITEAAATGDTRTTTQYAVLCSEVLCKVCHDKYPGKKLSLINYL